MVGIYKITNTDNGKVYIGQSVDITHRWNCHRYELRLGKHKNPHLQRAYDLNKKAFKFEVLHECKESELDDLEILFIKKYKSDDSRYGYNLNKGGNGAGRMSDETKKKMSKSKMGNKVMCGMKLSDEWKKHLSESQPHKKKILCIDTGIVFDSFADAARKTGLQRTKIVSVCTGHRKSTGGFRFRYADKESGN